MTRNTIASLFVAASFLLPAAAFAQSPATEAVCKDAAYLLENQVPTMPGVAEAVAICDQLFVMKSYADELMAEREAAEDEMARLDLRHFELRVDMAAAKATYAAAKTTANFYALIGIQKEFNSVSAERAEVSEDIAEMDASLADMFAELEVLEAALFAVIP